MSEVKSVNRSLEKAFFRTMNIICTKKSLHTNFKLTKSQEKPIITSLKGEYEVTPVRLSYRESNEPTPLCPLLLRALSLNTQSELYLRLSNEV